MGGVGVAICPGTADGGMPIGGGTMPGGGIPPPGGGPPMGGAPAGAGGGCGGGAGGIGATRGCGGGNWFAIRAAVIGSRMLGPLCPCAGAPIGGICSG
jgi:hypothetical protein